MSVITTDQQKLVLNAFAATFQNNLLAADIVDWKGYEGEMEDTNRFSVAEQVVPRYVVTQTENGIADLTAGVQESVFGSEQYTVNRTFSTSMGWGDFQKIRDLGSARESNALQSAATQLAEQIDAYILRMAALAPNNHVGTPGNAVSTLGHVAAAYTRLKEEGVDDADLKLVLSYADREALSNTLVTYPATDSLSTGAFRKGFEGMVNGVPTMFTQQLPTMTNGTRTNGTVAGANQNVNYKAVAISGQNGHYLTQTINLAGLGANGTIRDGEVFTIAGVMAYDNRLGASLGRLQQFRVVGDVTADGAGAANVRIFPAIIVPGSGAGGDINVNTAHATVTAAPANSAAVTFLGAASLAHRPRILLKKDEIVVCSKPLIAPATGQSATKSLTKVPVSVRMWRDSNFSTGAHRVRFDVALTANVRERRFGVRVNG